MGSLLAARFRQEVAKSKDNRMKNETEFGVGYPTGFLSFDFMNGTVVHCNMPNNKKISYYSLGIQDGSMVLIIGRSGCGKTTFAIQAAANIIRPYESACIFHDDIEGGISDVRKQQLTKFYTHEEFKNRYIPRNTGITAENFYERIKMIYDIKTANRADYEYDTGLYDTYGNRIYKLQPTVYILDSLAMLMPEKYTEEEELSGQMSSTAAAKTNASIFKRVIPMLKSANIILFIINHITQDVSINPMMKSKSQVSYLKQGETLPGGRTPVYLSNTMIRLDDHSKLKSTEGFYIDGTLVDITLIKSRTAKAGSTCTLVFNQDIGFDEELSLFYMLKDSNKVNGAGAYLYLSDRSDMKFAQKQLKTKLQDPEFNNVFQDVVMNTLKEQLDTRDFIPEVEEDDIEEVSVTSSIINRLNNFEDQNEN